MPPSPEADILAWLTLALAPGVGPVIGPKLVKAAGGDIHRVLSLDAAAMADLPGIGPNSAAKLVTALRQGRDEGPLMLVRCRELGHQVITLADPLYPALLRDIYDPPMVLYVWGTLVPLDVLAVAIVGSRKCSIYGSEQSRRFAGMFATAAHTVVSGGARGIDSAAHEGALSIPSGRTIAVTGCGLDVIYPPENGPLYDRIASDGGQRGAVVSEYPPGTEPNRQNFPRRNRIISGLSRGVLVIEAEEISGALITARVATDDHNRPVFALPGRIDNPAAAGPHQLIRDGAILVTRPQDVLDELGDLPDAAAEVLENAPTPPAPASLFDTPPAPPPPPYPTPTPQVPPATTPVSRPAQPKPKFVPASPLTPGQAAIVAALKGETLSVDQIVERSGLEPSAVLGQLTLLSLRGIVARVEGRGYTVRNTGGRSKA